MKILTTAFLGLLGIEATQELPIDNILQNVVQVIIAIITIFKLIKNPKAKNDENQHESYEK